ncbi:MAG: glycoside hydrolase family 2 TIM barrel-domain containing protein [Parafilimonas sp.]
MIKKISALIFFSFICTHGFSQKNMLFDDGWKFYKGGFLGGQNIDCNDAGWRTIDVPHDWSIEDLPNTNSPFNKDAISQVGGGFTSGGTAWYRKHFTVNKADSGKAIRIQFDGVYMNADVWINGDYLGNHPYGYTGFSFDITSRIKFDADNIIAVEVKNEGTTSRWYSGSGIYRHVWLQMLSPTHIPQDGVFITTSNVSLSSAKININTEIFNQSKSASSITLQTIILNDKGIEVAKQSSAHEIKSYDAYTFKGNSVIQNPQLWSTEDAILYTVVTDVYQDDKLIDEQKTKFGIRTISVDAINGFQLNGKTIKLKGACFHNDNGPLGSKAYDRAEQRKVELLKASGFNAIRCSHNPPSPAFLDACDSLGILVMDEAFDCWNYGKNSYDYHLYFKDWWQSDIASMVLRDRNHPSIIMWSIGNEIVERQTANGDTTAAMLSRFVRSIDSTRPITSAYNSIDEKADAYFASLDVAGYNYNLNKYVSDHQRKPNRVMVCTESYPLTAFDYWMGVIDNPWVIGDFVWTGFDYIGEASIGWLGYDQNKDFYPWNLAYCGDIDICGWKRPQSFYRDALWKENQLSVFVKPLHPSFPINPKKEEWSIWNWDDVVADWNWKGFEDSTLEVNVYSSCDEVELFLNGKSLGKKPTNRSTKFMAVYNVPYKAGELKAVGYRKDEKVNESILKTADEPTQIKLSADRNTINADGEDLSYVTVELPDDKGIRNPKAENLIHFSIEGEGTIVGVGNANPTSLESYQLPQRKAWQGRCMVVIKSTHHSGKIILKASADGLKSSQVEITSN